MAMESRKQAGRAEHDHTASDLALARCGGGALCTGAEGLPRPVLLGMFIAQESACKRGRRGQPAPGPHKVVVEKGRTLTGVRPLASGQCQGRFGSNGAVTRSACSLV